MYISWAALYEGRSDAAYFNVLLPRVIETVLREEGTRPFDVGIAPSVQFGLSERSFADAAIDICERRAEFHFIFVHADTGGRSQEMAISARREALIEAAVEQCDFDIRLAVYLSPRKELESWAVTDPSAINAAFGVSRLPNGFVPATPRAAEKLEDPKALLTDIGREVGRRKKVDTDILVRIAQEQDIYLLRQTNSFQEFEKDLRATLKFMRAIG